jgi:hypothetical protein
MLLLAAWQPGRLLCPLDDNSRWFMHAVVPITKLDSVYGDTFMLPLTTAIGSNRCLVKG